MIIKEIEEEGKEEKGEEKEEEDEEDGEETCVKLLMQMIKSGMQGVILIMFYILEIINETQIHMSP